MGDANWFSRNDNQNEKKSNNNGNYSYKPFDDFNSKNQEIINLKKKNKNQIFIIIYLILGFLVILISISYWVYKSKNPSSINDMIMSGTRADNSNEAKIEEGFKPSESNGPSLKANEIYRRCFKSVVGILIEKERDGFFSMPSTIRGSGVVVKLNNDLYILTNAHVLSGCSKGFSDISIFVSSDEKSADKENSKEIKATLLGKDKSTDLAVLKVEEKDLSSIPIGDSSKLEPGKTVYAIGSPLGLQGTITRGIVSALNREISNDVWSTKFIQIDTAINPGNSGGALINEYGELVGINTLKLKEAESLGFAIPINDVAKYATELIKNGKISRPAIGVSTDDNLVIKGFSSNSELKQFARVGDRIVGIDGKSVNNPDELRRIIKDHSIGDRIQVSIKDSVSGLVSKKNIVLKELK